MSKPKLEIDEEGTKRWFLDGKLHREDGPAVEKEDGERSWWINDELHREDGPAIEKVGGSKYWCLNGILHREDGPAVEEEDGTKEWYLNSRLHREDGPAREKEDGTKEWYLNDELHRVDGPAIIHADGSEEWWVDGKQLTEEEFNERVSIVNKEIMPLVVQDLIKRTEKGIKEYGEPLKANNGRDALWDAYEEALDMVQYLRQAIEERDNAS